MSDFFLYGFIQGVTEFFPVSSSGHLYLLKKLFGAKGDYLYFFIFLHIATLLAIFIFLRKKLPLALKDKNFILHIAIITFITAVIGLCIDKFIEPFFESRLLVPICLGVTGALVLSTKKLSIKRDSLKLCFKDSIFLGVLQGLSVLPGLSRSGITISGLLLRGLRPKDAFFVSFLMAIPATAGAFILKSSEIFKPPNIAFSGLFAGFFAALITGISALAILRKLMENQRFYMFGYYCFFISIVSIFLFK
ncbi:MAG: undecaprenyl-diphosphate phosphatase [Candidatus Omnitrophota bacterium]